MPSRGGASDTVATWEVLCNHGGAIPRLITLLVERTELAELDRARLWRYPPVPNKVV